MNDIVFASSMKNQMFLKVKKEKVALPQKLRVTSMD